ncbi:recombination-associated protein RdgC [Candidiatus Paracoxiella cheracis]|uniref:recombination-associated protein RdgC n=1 Tax=Candidiatus Paracoxiella cheracis TaxID=3405120 RepID=UPI003BF5E1BC
MWFKQATLFQLSDPVLYKPDRLEEQLAQLSFKSCLPSMPSSAGWVSPIDKEDAPLVHAANGYLLMCLQLEEKVLPAAVVRQELDERIKTIAATQDRKVSQKEKFALKDEIIHTLLPRAFSKFSRIYATIYTKNKWLIIDTTTPSKVEKFLNLFKRSMDKVCYQTIETKKISPILTQWLLHDDCPRSFSIEKNCVLRDPNQETRIIRCQQQDLSASAIQSLLKDGCEVQQLSLNWQDKINFILVDDFTLKNMKYSDEILNRAKDNYGETLEQQFDADFYIMTELLSELLTSLLNLFSKNKPKQKSKPMLEALME